MLWETAEICNVSRSFGTAENGYKSSSSCLAQLHEAHRRIEAAECAGGNALMMLACDRGCDVTLLEKLADHEDAEVAHCAMGTHVIKCMYDLAERFEAMQRQLHVQLASLTAIIEAIYGKKSTTTQNILCLAKTLDPNQHFMTNAQYKQVVNTLNWTLSDGRPQALSIA